MSVLQQETLRSLRAQLWEACEQDIGRVTKILQGLGDVPRDEHFYTRAVILAQNPRRPSRKAKYQLTPEHRERYKTAYHKYQQQFPNWVADGHTLDPIYPDTSTANGLTQFCLKYLTWMGHRATRITTEGRSIVKNGETMRIPTLTRKGTADISATINGKAVMLEIKVGRDKPSPSQLKEQQRERAAGGIYEFVENVEGFFITYDSITLP